MDSARSRGRAPARLLAVCAVLFGLFLMHGSPAAAVGCHTSLSAPAPVMHHDHAAQAGDMAGVESALATPAASSLPMVHPGLPSMAGDHDTQCVATPVRDRSVLPTVGILAVGVLTVLFGWALMRRYPVAGAVGRRGPPTGGRALLLRVCTARM
ncbi:hypothetical protein GCM10010211_81780 [Streptomyces albospinus]|uniref:Uncharacterized protein n=1 Tax=Streptomyces albospinus TaxID=285515 RepID=A0ABQ2VQ93_9ACTN|nr:hypothetical protein [Streptomyces albospinus]GGV02084.1 hypothetical protein GCM10010211_81780 [Streptomyces albospinus]